MRWPQATGYKAGTLSGRSGHSTVSFRCLPHSPHASMCQHTHRAPTAHSRACGSNLPPTAQERPHDWPITITGTCATPTFPRHHRRVSFARTARRLEGSSFLSLSPCQSREPLTTRHPDPTSTAHPRTGAHHLQATVPTEPRSALGDRRHWVASCSTTTTRRSAPWAPSSAAERVRLGVRSTASVGGSYTARVQGPSAPVGG